MFGRAHTHSQNRRTGYWDSFTLVRSHRSVSEEEPLQALVAFQFVLEAVLVFLVGEFQQVEQLRRCLHDRERRVLGVVHNDWDAAVWI
jgi:hypothetical protein